VLLSPPDCGIEWGLAGEHLNRVPHVDKPDAEVADLRAERFREPVGAARVVDYGIERAKNTVVAKVGMRFAQPDEMPPRFPIDATIIGRVEGRFHEAALGLDGGGQVGAERQRRGRVQLRI
jgi:hypothetical protein